MKKGAAIKPKTQSARPKLFVVLPVFNDWVSLERLILELTQISLKMELHLIIIDDCSTQLGIEIQKRIKGKCKALNVKIELLRLAVNRGNQFAIWIGLNYIYQQVKSQDRILVMDSDGEDDPHAIPRLLAAHEEGTPTVAKRGNRTNSLTFKLWHLVYKKFFKYFTGENLDFGNFSLIDESVLSKILSDERANYMGYVGGILRTNDRINRIEIDRGPRYFGESKTSVPRLIQWGLLQVSPFNDSIFAQALKLTVKFTGACLSASIFFLILRLLGIAVIPGWTSLIVYISLAISFLLMILAAMFLTIFFLLNGVRIDLKLNSQEKQDYSAKAMKFLHQGKINV